MHMLKILIAFILTARRYCRENLKVGCVSILKGYQYFMMRDGRKYNERFTLLYMKVLKSEGTAMESECCHEISQTNGDLNSKENDTLPLFDPQSYVLCSERPASLLSMRKQYPVQGFAKSFSLSTHDFCDFTFYYLLKSEITASCSLLHGPVVWEESPTHCSHDYLC